MLGDGGIALARTRRAHHVENGIDHSVTHRQATHEPLDRHQVFRGQGRASHGLALAGRFNEDAALGGENFFGGEDGGLVTEVDADSIAATQQRRFALLAVGVPRDLHGVVLQRGDDDAIRGAVRVVVAVDVAQLAFGFGADIVDPPGRAAGRHGGDHGGGKGVDEFVGEDDAPLGGSAGGAGNHFVDFAAAAEKLDGLATPLLALIGQ